MNEENLYSDKMEDGHDAEKSSEQAYIPSEAHAPDRERMEAPDRNAAERASGYALGSDNSISGTPSDRSSVPYGSDRGNEQIPQEPKPEVSWNEPQPGLYREGTFQPRGEYYQTPSQGMDQQNSYQQNPYQQTQQEPYQAESQGFGIASMVMGIISLVLCCSCVNIPIAITAIIFGILQLVKTNSGKGAAITGIVTSALSIVIFFISLITMLASTDFQQGFENGFENGLEDFYYNYDIPNYDNGYHDDTF